MQIDVDRPQQTLRKDAFLCRHNSKGIIPIYADILNRDSLRLGFLGTACKTGNAVSSGVSKFQNFTSLTMRVWMHVEI